MRGKLRSYLFFFLIVLVSVSVSASVRSDEASPYEMLRSLHHLQDDVAAGKADALTKQADALAAFGARLHQTDLSAFNDARNIYALITYLFIGGDPDIVASLLQEIPEGLVSQYLVEGALAYAYNRRDDFLDTFSAFSLEEKGWPEALCLSIYLSLIPDQISKDPMSASARLDYIRLMAPGSLFEETAIRRQLRLAATLYDVKKINLLVRNYANRFSNSSYASSFWNEFAYVAPMIDSRLTDASLDRLISLVPLRIQYLTYLYIARTALIDGRVERAFHGARQADNLAMKLKIDNTAARFYYAASQVATPAAPRAIKMLQAIRADDLEERDRPLLDAARFIAKGVVYYPKSMIVDTKLIEKSDNIDDNVSLWHELTLESFPLPDDLGDYFSISELRRQNAGKSDEIADSLKRAQEKLDLVDQLLKEEVK